MSNFLYAPFSRENNYDSLYIKELEKAIRKHCCYGYISSEVIIQKARKKAKELNAYQSYSTGIIYNR